VPDKKCPQCGLWSTSSAISCDCGYNFEKGILEEAFHEPIATRKTFPFPMVSLSLGIIGILISPLLLWVVPDHTLYNLLGRGCLLPLGPILSLISLVAGIVALASRKTQRPTALIGIFLAILGLFACSVYFFWFLIVG